MDSSLNKSFSVEMKDSPSTPKIIKMSPITNLAHNLSGLTTSVAGTPIRRISWSNPIPGGDKIGLNINDLSPYNNTDSPTAERKLIQSRTKELKEHFLKPTRKPLLSDSDDGIGFSIDDLSPYKNKDSNTAERKLTKLEKMKMVDELNNLKPIRKAIVGDSDDDNKENFTPKLKNIIRPFRSTGQTFDSGYSYISSQQSSGCSSPFTIVKRSTHDDGENVDHGIYLDDLDDPPVSDSFSSLFTKPLNETLRSPKQPPVVLRRYKLPMRRCLSTEMGFDVASGPSTSKSETYAMTTIESSDHDTDGNCNFKRPDPPEDLSGLQSKRRRSSPSIHFTPRACTLHRSYSETAATIMHAILKSDLQPELIGDGSRLCALPLIKGRHHDLMSITPYTLAGLINGEFKDVDSFVVVDCRYPYEFEGGHILGAKNIYTKEAIMEEFFADGMDVSKRNIIIFHCEFSSERAPNLCRFLRNKDRLMNEGNYPHLHHPEIYILEGGYKAFFHAYKELCEPQTYMPMSHKDHTFDLRYFRAKSKSWGADSKGRCQLRSHSKPSEI